MFGNIFMTIIITGSAWLFFEKTINITMATKIDAIFYMMIFGLIWSLFEIAKFDDMAKQAEMMRMYEAGKTDAQKGKNE